MRKKQPLLRKNLLEVLETGPKEKVYTVKIYTTFKTFLGDYLGKPVKTVLSLTPDHLLKITNFGRKSYIALVTKLYNSGITNIKNYPLGKYQGNDSDIKSALQNLGT